MNTVLQEAESAIAASRKAKHEAEQLKSRIEAAVTDGSIGRVPRRPISMYDSSAPVYYARDSSAARRQSAANLVRSVQVYQVSGAGVMPPTWPWSSQGGGTTYYLY